MTSLTLNSYVLSDEDKAAAINLAFLLDIFEYDSFILNIISENLEEYEKKAIYKFWAGLTPVCVRAWLCMSEFEGLINV